MLATRVLASLPVHRVLLALAASVALAVPPLALSGCGGSGAGGDALALGTITPSGGNVTIQVGPLAGAGVAAPPGAVAAPLAVTIADGASISTASAVVVGPALRIAPSGASFAVPVTVRMPFVPGQVPAGSSTLDLAVLRRDDASGAVEVLPATAVDAALGFVEARTLSLSTFQAAVLLVPESFHLTASGSLPPSSNIWGGAILGERQGIALMNTFGQVSFAQVIPFDPLTGARGATVAADPVLAFPPGLDVTSEGAAVASAAASFPSSAVARGAKLYVSAANLASGFGNGYNPGAVLVYPYDAATNSVGAFSHAILTNSSGAVYYNPTSIVPFERPAGTTLFAVVCGDDAFGTTTTAAVVVIDPATDAVLEAAEIGATTAGPAVLGPGARLYVGSTSRPELYVVDLSTSPPTVVRGAANPVPVPSQASGSDNISAVEVSEDRARLYALHFNDAGLSTYSLASPASPALVTRTAVGKRGNVGQDFVNCPQTLAVRPGAPGVDFQGPDIAVGTVLIDPLDRIVTGVDTAVDAYTTYGAAPSARLDALVAPFVAGDAVQHIVAPRHGRLAGRLYIFDGNHGKVVVRRFEQLR